MGNEQAKVLFRVPSEGDRADVETLWASALGHDQYQLDNSPFYAYSVSWNDIVLAPFDKAEDMPTFLKVVKKSGHRTIRIIFDPPVEDGNESDKQLAQLVELGCSFEGSNRVLISIDVPPEIDLQSIRLKLIEFGVNWEHADPIYEELFPDNA